MKYFTKCTTLEELKKEYKKLVMKYHPDINPNGLEQMQMINAEYDEVFPRLKNKHKNASGEAYEKENNEAPNEFKDLIEKLINMEGVTIEVIGCFVWVSGDTKQYKDDLKGLGFKWHSKKVCWYKAPADYRKSNKKQFDMDEIRNMFGVNYSTNAKAQGNRLPA